MAEPSNQETTPVANSAPLAELPSDQTLLDQFRRGNLDAATLLYLRHADHLRALASAKIPPDLATRVDPDDIVQTVFRTFFRRAALGQFQVPRGEDLWKLILVIALNKIRTAGAHHRAAKRDVHLTPQLARFDYAAHVTAGRDETALTVLRLVIEELLADLPSSHQQIIEQRIDGYEVAEIAVATGRSKRAVERILQEFRKRLAATLQEEA